MLKDNIQNLNSHLAKITSSLNAQFAKSGGGSLEKIKLSEVADEIRKIETLPKEKEFFFQNNHVSLISYINITYPQTADIPNLNLKSNLEKDQKISLGKINRTYIGTWHVSLSFSNSSSAVNDMELTEELYKTCNTIDYPNFKFINT